MQQSQALILMSQMMRIEKIMMSVFQMHSISTKSLKEIPGNNTLPTGRRRYTGCLSSLSFRYIKEQFNNIPKEVHSCTECRRIPCGNGYGKQNRDGADRRTAEFKGFKRLSQKPDLSSGARRMFWPGIISCVSGQ